jgi:hypothetical protein
MDTACATGGASDGEETGVTHMVIFQSSEGTPGYHQTESLDDAVRFVESLRNDQNVEQARIFRMEEIPFEFQSYYRVELGKTTSGLRVRGFALGENESIDLTAALAEPPTPAFDVEAEHEPPEAPDEVEQMATEFEREAEPVSSGTVGRRGLFGR